MDARLGAGMIRKCDRSFFFTCYRPSWSDQPSLHNVIRRRVTLITFYRLLVFKIAKEAATNRYANERGAECLVRLNSGLGGALPKSIRMNREGTRLGRWSLMVRYLQSRVEKERAVDSVVHAGDRKGLTRCLPRMPAGSEACVMTMQRRMSLLGSPWRRLVELLCSSTG